MKKMAELIFAKWWGFLLFGTLVLGVYLTLFLGFPNMFGWNFDLVLNTITVGLLLLLVILAIVHIFKSQVKSKKSKLLWALLFNVPLGLIGISAAYFVSFDNSQPYISAYSKKLSAICVAADADFKSGQDYPAVHHAVTVQAQALSEKMESQRGYSLDMSEPDADILELIYDADSIGCIGATNVGFNLSENGDVSHAQLKCEAGANSSCIYAASAFAGGSYRVAEDFNAAHDYMNKACDGGHIDACYWMGAQYQEAEIEDEFKNYYESQDENYFQFPSLIPSDKVATSYFTKVCELGSHFGCDQVKLMETKSTSPSEQCTTDIEANKNDLSDECNNHHFDVIAHGIKTNTVNERLISSKACDSGNELECSLLGHKYWAGFILDTDRDLGRHYYSKACALDIEGCETYVLMFQKGTDVNKKDAAMAFSFEKQICEADNSKCNAVGWAYDNGNGVSKNASEALKYYLLACEKGSSSGCNNVGVAYSDGNGVSKNASESLKYLILACEKGSGLGCYQAAYEYSEGTAVSTNITKAIELFDKACELEEPSACYSLAFDYWNGEMVAKDVEKAKLYAKKACDLDSDKCSNHKFLRNK